MRTCGYEGKWVEKLNGWPQTNVVEYFLCIGLVRYTRARKVSLCSSIMIMIILSYAMSGIYTIIHI